MEDHPDTLLIEVEPGIYEKELEIDYDFFTIIRDPIDRVLSLIELRSRPDRSPNIWNSPSYEHRKTDGFWNDVKKSLIPDCLWHYSNTITRSMSGDPLSPTTPKSSAVALKRLYDMPVLVYNKQTYARDLEEFCNRIGVGSTVEPIGHSMPGSETFRDIVPEWIIDLLKSLNTYDIPLVKDMSEKTDEFNIYIPLTIT